MVLQIFKWVKPPFHISQLWDKNVHPHVINPPLLGRSCWLHACILRKSSTEVQKVLREVVCFKP